MKRYFGSISFFTAREELRLCITIRPDYSSCEPQLFSGLSTPQRDLGLFITRPHHKCTSVQEGVYGDAGCDLAALSLTRTQDNVDE